MCPQEVDLGWRPPTGDPHDLYPLTVHDFFDFLAHVVGFAAAGQRHLPAQDPQRGAQDLALLVGKRLLEREPAQVTDGLRQRDGVSLVETLAIVHHPLGRAALGIEGGPALERLEDLVDLAAADGRRSPERST